MAHLRAYQNYLEKLVKCLPMDDTHFITQLSAQQLLPGDTESKIKALSTPSDKASYFLSHVIKPALDIDETSSFDKLLSIMLNCGYTHVQKLAPTIKCEIDKSNEIKSQPDEIKLQPDKVKQQLHDIKPKTLLRTDQIKSHTSDYPDAYIEKFKNEDVVGAFAYLFNKLRILFDEVNFKQLKNACIQRGTLLPTEFKQQIRAAEELDELLDVLDNPMYCNWLNTRLLKRIVVTIDIPEAERLIKAYEECVYSRKVSDVKKHFHSNYFIKSQVSLVEAKISTLFKSLTVADIIKYCQELESDMKVYTGSVTATECQPGCLLITCVIPIHCALHAYEMAKTNFIKFRQSHTQYIEIESYPKIFALKFSTGESNLDTLASEDTSQVSSHYYTSLENYMDADSVSHMMLCEHLITDDDYEAITAAPNDSKMNTLLLQYVRSMNVKQLSRFCDILKTTDSHKIIRDYSSPFFQAILQKLSTNMRIYASKQFMVSLIGQMEMSEVDITFYNLIDYLFSHLSATEKLPFDVEAYSNINPMFTKQWLRKIKSLFLFKIYLLPFITWLDHSILKELVIASGSDDAHKILCLFDDKINSYWIRPIGSFPIPPPSQLMIPLDDSEYTLLAMEFCLTSQDDNAQSTIILQDVMDIKLKLKLNYQWRINSHDVCSFQLVAINIKLKFLYWIISKQLVEVINDNLFHEWRCGIIKMTVLPANFYNLNNNSEKIKGSFSSFSFFWQGDGQEEKVPHIAQLHHEISEMSSHMKTLEMETIRLKEDCKKLSKRLENRGTEDQASTMEKKIEHIAQLSHENAEMTSRIKMLEMENDSLKEDKKKLAKHFGEKKAEKKEPKFSDDDPENVEETYQSCSPKLHIHQLMNIVPLIQEKWSLIGIKLKLSLDELDEICHIAGKQQIPTESKNTFCCIKMLTSWYKISDDVSVDAIMMAINAPHVGLKAKISSIEAALSSEYVITDSSEGKSVTYPPEKLEQQYVNMTTKFCLELNKSQCSIFDIVTYLKMCNVNSDVLDKVSDFPMLLKSFEKHELVNKADLSWLKNIAHHAKCTQGTKVIEEYESMLMADKIPWHSSHPMGTYLVGRTDKILENVTIKDSYNAKLVASKFVDIKESDSVLQSAEVGSVTFYWKLVNYVAIQIPIVTNTSLIRKCRAAGLTHVGIMIDGNLSWTVIDHMGKYPSLKETDKKELDLLLFNALTMQPFGPVKELVLQLLDVGVPVTIKDQAESIPLAVAVKQKCPINIIRRLMACTNLKLLLQSKNKHKLTAIHEAALANNHEALLLIFNEIGWDAPLEVNTTNREEQIRSCHYGQPDLASDLYKILNNKNKEGWTALHYAADRGHVEMLHLLLMVEQCDVILSNKHKKTAFHLAAKGGHLLCLQLLFAAAESRGLLRFLPKIDKNGWNLACHASAQLKCDIKVMEWLLRKMPEHTDINHITKKGYTPLLLACEYQNMELVQLLVNHEQLSELMTVIADGKTALHLAAIHDSVEIVRLLIDKGVPINNTDNENGETALHIACKKGSHEVENVLIAEGADQAIINKDGNLPQEVKYSDLRIPAEIKKRGYKAIENYIVALKRGRKKMPRCKLVILGEAGVGKTNLFNLLTGEKFVPIHERTEGVEISLVTTFDIDTKTWKKSPGGVKDAEYMKIAASEVANQLKNTKPDNEVNVLPTPCSQYHKLNSVMKKYAEPPKSILIPAAATKHTTSSNRSHFPKNIRSHVPILPSQDSIAAAAATISSKSSSSSYAQDIQCVDTTDALFSRSPDISTSVNHLFTKIFHDALKMKSSEPLTLHLKLTSFDFAGQEHYKSMHQCFLTSRAVYIVTFNARHLLTDYKYQCVNEINYWVNSILVHTGVDARIILVGTHKGPYRPSNFDELNEKNICDIDNFLKKHLKNRFVFSYFNDDRIMALVESSIENIDDHSGAKVVQEKLKNLGESHPGNKDKLPLSYIRLESKIFEERSKRSENKLFLIPRDEVEQWATNFSIDDTNVALDFFHDIGIIVNPVCLPTLFVTKEDIQHLQGVVLIKPQWLTDVMKELINIDRGDDEKFKNMKGVVRGAIDYLIDTGKTDKKNVLFPLWQNYHNGSEQVFENICLFLEAYGVIIPIKQSQCYYIFCKLPQKVIIPKITSNCHNVRVDFKNGFFPPFIFQQLMFKMYQEIEDYNLSKCEFGKNECYIQYIDGCQWWLHQDSYDDIIDITIRTKSHIRTILPAMQLLDRILKKILKAKELNRICYKLGPVAECYQCEDKQLFYYITYDCKIKQKDDGQSITKEHIQCSSCCNEVPIKCDSETDRFVKSKNYKYGKSFEDFKKDLYYDGLDDKLRSYLNEQFLMDLRKEDATTATVISDDSRIIQRWYKQHQDDPWPLVAAHLSYYDNDCLELDKIKYNFLYMHNHCL